MTAATSTAITTATIAAPARKQAAPDLWTLTECVWRYKSVAVITGCVLAVLGAAAGRFGIPAQFKATAMVRLAGPSGVIETPHESSNAQREFRSTQQELMKMPHVLKRALESPKVAELGELGADSDAVDDLASWLKIDLPRSSEIVRISVQHERADIAYLLANAVTDAYLQEVYRDAEADVTKRLATLDKLHTATEERLSKAWNELQALARQLGSGDPAALSLQAQAEIENYRDYTRRLRQVRSEKREAERVVKSIKEAPETLSKEMPEDASMHSVKYAMFQARLRREQALGKWGPKHPDVVTAEQEEKLLREYYQKSLTEEERPPKSRHEELLAEPLATIARLSSEELALGSLLEEIEERMKVLGGDNAAKLEILRNDIARQEGFSDTLWKSRERLQVESHADKRVQLVSYASVPRQRDTSKRNKLTLVLAAGGFGFAIGLFALGEFLTGRVHSQRDAAQRTGVEILAALPKLARAPRAALETKPASARYDQMRTQLELFLARLLHHPQVRQPRKFLVTSPHTPGEREGLAMHLASSLAAMGKKTLFIQLDLRDPNPLPELLQGVNTSVSKLLDTNHSSSSLGATSFDWDACLGAGRLATRVPQLHFLPAGTELSEPLKLLTHPGLNNLIERLTHHYDYLVFDVSGVLDYPDAVHASPLADAAILSLLCNTTTARSTSQAYDRLASTGLPVIGVLLA